jgi:hypothetical protein
VGLGAHCQALSRACCRGLDCGAGLGGAELGRIALQGSWLIGCRYHGSWSTCFLWLGYQIRRDRSWLSSGEVDFGADFPETGRLTIGP